MLATGWELSVEKGSRPCPWRNQYKNKRMILREPREEANVNIRSEGPTISGLVSGWKFRLQPGAKCINRSMQRNLVIAGCEQIVRKKKPCVAVCQIDRREDADISAAKQWLMKWRKKVPASMPQSTRRRPHSWDRFRRGGAPFVIRRTMEMGPTYSSCSGPRAYYHPWHTRAEAPPLPCGSCHLANDRQDTDQRHRVPLVGIESAHK